MEFQLYCSLNDLNDDADPSSGGYPVSAVSRFIGPASAYLAQEIGAFLPSLSTLKLTGNGGTTLEIPALLSLTGDVINDEITIPSTDYVLRYWLNNNRTAWPNGPYNKLVRAWDATTLGFWNMETDSVEIPGEWGYWKRLDTTGATVASDQNVSVETLSVNDGSKIAVGMALSIGAEMEVVTDYGTPTAAATTLSSSLTAASETVAVASGAAVKIGEIIRVDFERMKVLDIQTNTLLVARGWGKTQKNTHNSAANVDVYRTFAVARACNGTSAAAHSTSTVVKRYAIPDDIVYLARQIAMLMLKKAGSGFAGKTGSPEMGEVFYFHEFPRDEIMRIKRNYSLV